MGWAGICLSSDPHRRQQTRWFAFCLRRDRHFCGLRRGFHRVFNGCLFCGFHRVAKCNTCGPSKDRHGGHYGSARECFHLLCLGVAALLTQLLCHCPRIAEVTESRKRREYRVFDKGVWVFHRRIVSGRGNIFDVTNNARRRRGLGVFHDAARYRRNSAAEFSYVGGRRLIGAAALDLHRIDATLTRFFGVLLAN